MFRFPNGLIDLDQLASGQDCDRVENLNYLHELGCLSKAKLVKTQVVRWKQALKKLDKEEFSKNSYHFWREAFIWYWLFKENEGYIQEKIISSIKTSLKMVRKRRKKKRQKKKESFPNVYPWGQCKIKEEEGAYHLYRVDKVSLNQNIFLFFFIFYFRNTNARTFILNLLKIGKVIQHSVREYISSIPLEIFTLYSNYSMSFFL